MAPNSFVTFGTLLKQFRKRAGMTQADLAAAVGYSIAFISNLELNQRLPDLQMVMETFVPALGLQDEPNSAAALIEQAALARGQRVPASITFQRTTQLSLQEERTTDNRRLPSLPTELVGRAADVNQLCNRLLGHGGRLLTLVGPPGIGKTTLALAVAARLQFHYPHGTVFVPLAAVSDPILMAATIVTAVGSDDSSPKPPKARLIEMLRHKTMLLVLDNLEQLLAPPLSGADSAVGLLADLVAGCPGLCILATSRERLHLRAEQRYKVPPLALAFAVQMFVQQAQAVDSDFTLTPHNQPTLETICQRLDCLPLALELCAAQVDILPPIQLLAQLQDHRLDMLVDGALDLPERQRTLRAAIGTSYALLNEVERMLLRALGIFVGGFDLDAVQAISAERVEPSALYGTLQSLIGKSLVRAEKLPHGEHRFMLLETIREFALEQAQAQDEEPLLRQRHYAIYLQCFRTADSHLRGAEAATWVSRMEPDQGNLRAALQWTLDETRYTDAAWLMVAVHYLWFLRGSRYEGAKWLAQLLPHRQTLAPDLRLVTLIAYYATVFELKEFPPIERYTDETIALLEICADKLLQAAAWYSLATTTTEIAQTATRIARCIVLVRAASEVPAVGSNFSGILDRDFLLASALREYGAMLIDQGEVARAVPIATESLALFRARGNRYGITECLGTLGWLSLLQGDLTQAHRLLHEVMTIATSFNLRVAQGGWQPLLGIVTLYEGDALEARRLLNDSLHLCIELKNKFFLARVCTYLAELDLWDGEIAQAEQWLAQSLGQQTDPHRNTIFQVRRLFVAARLATAQQLYTRAATLFGLADQMHSQIHHVIAGPIRTLADASLLTVRTALEPAFFDEAFAAGQLLSLEDAFTTILAPSSIASMRDLSPLY